MKMNKKKVLSLALVIAMIAILSFSSLAWFSDADEVTNKFMIASSEGTNEPEDIFSVDVWEPNDNPDTNGDGLVDSVYDGDGDGKLDEKFDKDGDGKLDEEYKYQDQDGMEFNNVLPGATYSKEPHVENTGAYNQYVRVNVVVGDVATWQNLLRKYEITDLSTIFLGHNEADWIRLDTPNPVNNTLSYTYYLEKVLKPGEDVALFTDVKIPYQFTQEDMASFGGDFKIKIVAEAVQVEGMPETVTNALTAFKQVEGDQTIDVIK